MLNRVILIGRLTRDPELTYTPAGIAITKFNLAVDRPFSSSNGEKETDFIPIVVWRQLAETCANYLRKGRLTAVEGRIQVRSYEDNSGKRVYVTEVVGDNVRFLESNRDVSENNSTSSHNNREGTSRQGNKGNQGRQNLNIGARNNLQDPFKDDGRPIDISEDDLPF